MNNEELALEIEYYNGRTTKETCDLETIRRRVNSLLKRQRQYGIVKWENISIKNKS